MLPAPVRDLIQLLRTLPGVGEKAATKHAVHLVSSRYTQAIGTALTGLGEAVVACGACGALQEAGQPCAFCARPAGVLCVVHRYVDLLAVERAAPGRVRYFVLGKLLAPVEGVTEADLPVDGLLRAADEAEEVVLGLPASVSGEATAILLSRHLAAVGKRVTKLARGLAHGSDLEFADPITMRGAFDGRVEVKP